MPAEVITDALKVIYLYCINQLSQIPGMGIVFDYVKSSYQNDPFRVGLEALLVFFTARYLLSKPKKSSVELTEKEIDELVNEWEPEPLVHSKQQEPHDRIEEDPLVSQVGIELKAESGKSYINMVSQNYLGLHNSERIKSIAIETVKKYGVGSCGPCGFYGTLDVHLQLEKEIARVLGTESAIIYAQGFSAVSSVIPAFSKRGDIIVADEMVNVALLKGIQISRSRVYFHKHNDMEDLERVLSQIDFDEKKKGKQLTRRFIVSEGIFLKTGNIANLRNLIALKERFKYRLILDESNSFGAIGPRGIGAGDYFGVPSSDIDIIVGNISGAMGAAGGFCAGSEAVVDHQRLSSQAYCFSASLPAVLAKCALENLLELEARPELAKRLAQNVKEFKSLLKQALMTNGCPFEISGHPDSPLSYLRLTHPLSSFEDEEKLLFDLVENIRDSGVYVTLPGRIQAQEHLKIRPAIKFSISSELDSDKMKTVTETLVNCMKRLKVNGF